MTEYARFVRSADLWECPSCNLVQQESCDVGGDWVACRDCEWTGIVLPDGESP